LAKYELVFVHKVDDFSKRKHIPKAFGTKSKIQNYPQIMLIAPYVTLR